MSIRLNIGSSNTRLHGYINIDKRESVNPDIVADAHKLHYEDSTVSEILASHVLEHCGHGINIDNPDKVTHPNVVDVLKEWYRVLRHGGRLEVRTPNIAAIDYLFDESDILVLNMMLYGGQENQEDFHRSIFNWKLLRERLQEVGFVNINRILNCTDDNGKHPQNLVCEAFKP